jgi:hypothetical protein
MEHTREPSFAEHCLKRFAEHCLKHYNHSLRQTFTWLVYLNEEEMDDGSLSDNKNFTPTLSGFFATTFSFDDNPDEDFHEHAVIFNVVGTVACKAKLVELSLLDTSGRVLREVSDNPVVNGKSIQTPADGFFLVPGDDIECGPVWEFVMSDDEFKRCIRNDINGRSFALTATIEVRP